MEDFGKNKPGWVPTVNDYRLIFRQIDGEWREITNNLPQYRGMLLADYLEHMEIVIDCDCQFCRVVREGLTFEYRVYGGSVRIDVLKQ